MHRLDGRDAVDYEKIENKLRILKIMVVILAVLY